MCPSSRRLARPFSSLFVLALLAAGCGSDESSGKAAEEAVRKPFAYASTTAVQKYRQVDPGGVEWPLEARDAGEETWAGKSFRKLEIRNPEDPAAPATTALVRPLPVRRGETLEIGVLAGPAIRVEADPPVSIDLGVPAGEAQPFAFTTQLRLPEGGGTIEGELAGNFTIGDEDAAVDTALGRVEGCLRFDGEGTLAAAGVPGQLVNVPVSGSVWVHPDRGVVAAELPSLGISWDHEGAVDLGLVSDGHRAIARSGVIRAGQPVFELDSFDVAGELDADKMVHARMLLELRWVDEDRARGDTRPGYPAVNVEFGTVWGTFPAELQQSPVSIFHPEENGKGYVYWVGFVDQAAKNEPGEGTAYHVRVEADTDITPPLRATARIVYPVLEP